jgi:hypothetical protein
MHLSVDDGLRLVHEIRRLRDMLQLRCEACHAARERIGVADGH